jgi:hypothetical protein
VTEQRQITDKSWRDRTKTNNKPTMTWQDRDIQQTQYGKPWPEDTQQKNYDVTEQRQITDKTWQIITWQNKDN